MSVKKTSPTCDIVVSPEQPSWYLIIDPRLSPGPATPDVWSNLGRMGARHRFQYHTIWSWFIKKHTWYHVIKGMFLKQGKRRVTISGWQSDTVGSTVAWHRHLWGSKSYPQLLLDVLLYVCRFPSVLEFSGTVQKRMVGEKFCLRFAHSVWIFGMASCPGGPQFLSPVHPGTGCRLFTILH